MKGKPPLGLSSIQMIQTLAIIQTQQQYKYLATE